MQVINLSWEITKGCATAEGKTLAARLERLQDPQFERWVWMIDVLDSFMTDGMSTSLLAHGIEETLPSAIAAAENAIAAAEAAIELV